MSTFFLFSLLALGCSATIVDDTDSQWSYNGWSASPCLNCKEKPDPSQASGGSWHETTNPSASASYQIPATTVKIYGILPTNPDGRATYGTNVTILVNGQQQGELFQDNSVFQSYQYNVEFATVTGPGLLEIVNNDFEGTPSVAILDYLDVQGATTTTTTAAPGSVTGPAQTSTTSSTAPPTSASTTPGSKSASSTSSSASAASTVFVTSTDSAGVAHTIPVPHSGSQSASSSAPSSSSSSGAAVILTSKKSMTAVKIFVPIGLVLLLLSAVFLYLHRKRSRNLRQSEMYAAAAYKDHDAESQTRSTLMGGDHFKANRNSSAARSSIAISHASYPNSPEMGTTGLPPISTGINGHKPSESWAADYQYAADLLAGAEAALSPRGSTSTGRPSTGGRPGTGGSGTSPKSSRMGRHGEAQPF